MTTEEQDKKAGVREAYKAIIDFNKTVVSIASVIAAGLISFLSYQDTELDWASITSIVLLLMSICATLFGFGLSIYPIQDGKEGTDEERTRTLFFSNISGGLLLAGIIFTIFIDVDSKPTVKELLNNVQTQTSEMKYDLRPVNCVRLEFEGDNYRLVYRKDTVQTEVVYSPVMDKVVSIR